MVWPRPACPSPPSFPGTLPAPATLAFMELPWMLIPRAVDSLSQLFPIWDLCLVALSHLQVFRWQLKCHLLREGLFVNLCPHSPYSLVQHFLLLMIHLFISLRNVSPMRTLALEEQPWGLLYPLPTVFVQLSAWHTGGCFIHCTEE